MKSKLFAVLALLLLVLTIDVGADTPTVTRAKDYSPAGSYHSVKNTWTSTTNSDSVLILNGNGGVFETAHHTVNNTIFKLLFNSAEGTASSVDKVVKWQVSAVSDAGSGISDVTDWVIAETDSINNSNLAVATFDAANYKGMKVRVLLHDTANNSAVAEEAYIVVYEGEK